MGLRNAPKALFEFGMFTFCVLLLGVTLILAAARGCVREVLAQPPAVQQGQDIVPLPRPDPVPHFGLDPVGQALSADRQRIMQLEQTVDLLELRIQSLEQTRCRCRHRGIGQAAPIGDAKPKDAEERYWDTIIPAGD